MTKVDLNIALKSPFAKRYASSSDAKRHLPSAHPLDAAGGFEGVLIQLV